MPGDEQRPNNEQSTRSAAGDGLPAAVAHVLAALARCDRAFRDAELRLRGRHDLHGVSHHLYLQPVDGGGRAELDVTAALDERGVRWGQWGLTATWAADGWTIGTGAHVFVRGRPAELLPAARWTGTSAAEFGAVVEAAAVELLAGVATADLAGPQPPLAVAAARVIAREEHPPAVLGIPRADWVRAYVLDGLAESEAERRVDALLGPTPESGRASEGGHAFPFDWLVPLARLGPPLSDALRTRLEREVAESAMALAGVQASLDRVVALTPPAAP